MSFSVVIKVFGPSGPEGTLEPRRKISLCAWRNYRIRACTAQVRRGRWRYGRCGVIRGTKNEQRKARRHAYRSCTVKMRIEWLKFFKGDTVSARGRIYVTTD